MSLKDYFDKIDIQEINSFITNQTSEDLYLEFKTANYPNGIEFDKKNFSKCISGFANSGGGILIWGVSAKEEKGKPDVASELKPIKNLIDFETYLKKNEGNAIVPLVDGIEYKRIFEDKDSGFLIVYIPQSERAPHMALFADKRYYKRSGDSFYMCEHFDIMDMIQRKTTPILTVEINNENIYKLPNRGELIYRYNGVFSVKNIGQVSLKHLVVFIKVNPPFQISDFGIDGNRNSGMNKIASIDSFRKYIGGSEVVVHPETSHDVDRIVLNEINQNSNIHDLVIDYKIIAEGMKLLTGQLIKRKEELIK